MKYAIQSMVAVLFILVSDYIIGVNFKSYMLGAISLWVILVAGEIYDINFKSKH